MNATLVVMFLLSTTLPRALGSAGAAPLNTFTVTTTADGSDVTAPAGSLRKAILNANATPGQDLITFNIPGSGVRTITLSYALPVIRDSVIIDGNTQGAHLIELNGSNVTNADALLITASNSTIRGLVINRFSGGAGVHIMGAGATGNRIEGNRIGTNAAGTAALRNANGVVIESASNNVIGGTAGTTPGGACNGACNLLSGNNNGVILSGAPNNTLVGNYMGTNAAGNGAVPNSEAGILLANSSRNTIGGASPAARNVLSGNAQMGMEFGLGSSGNLIQGNFIGTNSAGNAAVGNGGSNGEGVFLAADSSNNTFSGNVISGNIGFGIIVRPTANGNQFFGNLIGTDASGNNPLGNRTQGIELQSSFNNVGGT